METELLIQNPDKVQSPGHLGDDNENEDADNENNNFKMLQQQAPSAEWHEALELIGVKTQNGKLFYKVKWKDLTAKPSWSEDHHVNI